MVLNRLFYALLMIGQVRGAGRSKRDDGQEKAPGMERDAQHLSPKHANEDLGGEGQRRLFIEGVDCDSRGKFVIVDLISSR